MSRSRHTEAQIIGVLKQVEASRKAEDVAREVGVSKHTIYGWKSKYGGMDVSQAQEAKQFSGGGASSSYFEIRIQILFSARTVHEFRETRASGGKFPDRDAPQIEEKRMGGNSGEDVGCTGALTS